MRYRICTLFSALYGINWTIGR